jgi:hypothetical protein
LTDEWAHDTELKRNSSVIEHENYCRKIQIQMAQGYYGMSTAMRVTGKH